MRRKECEVFCSSESVYLCNVNILISSSSLRKRIAVATRALCKCVRVNQVVPFFFLVCLLWLISDVTPRYLVYTLKQDKLLYEVLLSICIKILCSSAPSLRTMLLCESVVFSHCNCRLRYWYYDTSLTQAQHLWQLHIRVHIRNNTFIQDESWAFVCCVPAGRSAIMFPYNA